MVRHGPCSRELDSNPPLPCVQDCTPEALCLCVGRQASSAGALHSQLQYHGLRGPRKASLKLPCPGIQAVVPPGRPGSIPCWQWQYVSLRQLSKRLWVIPVMEEHLGPQGRWWLKKVTLTVFDLSVWWPGWLVS